MLSPRTAFLQAGAAGAGDGFRLPGPDPVDTADAEVDVSVVVSEAGVNACDTEIDDETGASTVTGEQGRLTVQLHVPRLDGEKVPAMRGIAGSHDDDNDSGDSVDSDISSSGGDSDISSSGGDSGGDGGGAPPYCIR